MRAMLAACVVLAGCAATPERSITPPVQDCPKPVPVTCPAGADEIPDLMLVDLPPVGDFNGLSDEQKLRKMLEASTAHRVGQMQMRDQLSKAVACVKALRGAP